MEPSLAPIPLEVPPLIAKRPLSQLERDLNEYQSRSHLSIMECNALEEKFKKEYSKFALQRLLEILSAQKSAQTMQDALDDLENACRKVNEEYPLNWKVATNLGKKTFGLTTRYDLLSHTVWLNPNGAYCIKITHNSRLIFSKPSADGAVFKMPDDS